MRKGWSSRENEHLALVLLINLTISGWFLSLFYSDGALAGELLREGVSIRRPV
jgi:hypothetical protein